MFTTEDKALLAKKGITEEQIERQLECFKKGFPFLKLKAPAAIGAGIFVPGNASDRFKNVWDSYTGESGRKIAKFVPASGAASRMFKSLFEFLDAAYEKPSTPFEKAFFAGIHHFAFYDDLDAACVKNEGKSVDRLMAQNDYKKIVVNLLRPQGLNYGALPKGLLKFHNYSSNGARTPLEEHLVEAALYASVRNEAYVHFTVSAEHRSLFEALVKEKVTAYESKYGVSLHVTFSEQKASTDTVAANVDNTPFRIDGQLFFRPGGHGALIENLNDIEADIIFIKNIDNVVPDRLKQSTVESKKILGGVLVENQSRAFHYLNMLDKGQYCHAEIEEIIRFVQQTLCCRKENLKDLEDAELVNYLYKKLNRPMRVCGVVKNVGEPGGGPFLAYNADGTVSPQILESSQIDKNNPEYVAMFKNGTHFNPVDLVCAVKDYKGNKFDLTKYVDHNTGFISMKSKNGKDLKALELPGLWNGAMSDWNTIFVEVPLSTFNPVKTVNDLLRSEHQ